MGVPLLTGGRPHKFGYNSLQEKARQEKIQELQAKGAQNAAYREAYIREHGVEPPIDREKVFREYNEGLRDVIRLSGHGISGQQLAGMQAHNVVTDRDRWKAFVRGGNDKALSTGGNSAFLPINFGSTAANWALGKQVADDKRIYAGKSTTTVMGPNGRETVPTPQSRGLGPVPGTTDAQIAEYRRTAEQEGLNNAKINRNVRDTLRMMRGY